MKTEIIIYLRALQWVKLSQNQYLIGEKCNAVHAKHNLQSKF